MDKDEGSIGGLENPPPATKKLYYASIIFDCIGLILSLLISIKFMFIILVYIAVSKAYSWHGIRLKKYGLISWVVVMIFQGGYTLMLVQLASSDSAVNWFNAKTILAFCAASTLIGGFYPLTQIYQHGEDKKRGDNTISSILGVKGTFIFSLIFFLLAFAEFFLYFKTYYNITQFYLFMLCLIPVSAFFVNWFYKSLKNKTYANYRNAMRINVISACCMISCFSILYYLNHK